MFVQALEQILKKINKSKNKEQGFKMLEKKIFSSPVLKQHYSVYNSLKENTKKLYKPSSINSFISELKESKLQDGSIEIKELLEYFNINPSDVKPTVMDSAMNLNESAIKKVVVNREIQSLTEDFKRIIRDENLADLETEFKFTKRLSENVTDASKREMLLASIETINESKITHFNSTAKKLYKLRTLVENILSEAVPGPDGGRKEVGLSDLNYVKRPKVEAPSMWKRPESIMLKFAIPFYPIGQQRTHAMTSAINAKRKVQNMSVSFGKLVNKFPSLFDVDSIIWKCKFREQAFVGKPVIATFVVFINTNQANVEKNSFDSYVKAGEKILASFDAVLPKLMGDLEIMLSPDAMKEKGKSDTRVINRYKVNKSVRAPKTKVRKNDKGEELFDFSADDYGY